MWIIVARPQVRIGEYGCSGSIGWVYGRRKQVAQTSNAKKQRQRSKGKEAKAKKQRKTSDEDEQRTAGQARHGPPLTAAISRDERFRAPASRQNEAQAVKPPNLVGDPEQANA
jgi:hypothetical protein